MRTILSCDDVFEVLTRAPFPNSGSDSESVETHLSACHECRCLAEALRPAIGLFHEALADDKDALPIYRGKFHAPEPVRNRRRLASPSHLTRRPFGGWVVAAGLLVAVGVLLSGLWPHDEVASHAVAIRPVADRDVGCLASLHVPNACVTPQVAEAAARVEYDCCTKCHRADSTVNSSPAAIVKSSAACLACHEWYSLSKSRSGRGLLGCLMACDTTFHGVAWE